MINDSIYKICEQKLYYNMNNYMKLDNETKISDLIPEGFQLTFENNGQIFSEKMNDVEYLNIPLKRIKIESTFENYIEKFFGILNYLNDVYRSLYLKYFLKEKSYNDIPFEIKIGLLKYICDDLKVDIEYINITY